jgi:hypothetical protein
MNLITTLFFKTGKIYEITFGLLKIKLQDEVDDMINKYRELNNITPQQLGINKQFCLNEVTLDYQASILEKEIKKLDEHSGKDNEGGKDENNLDLNDKGVANIYFIDDNLDKKKMQELLTNIRTMKKPDPIFTAESLSL